jgi:type IV secretory pathway TrbF-like protein
LVRLAARFFSKYGTAASNWLTVASALTIWFVVPQATSAKPSSNDHASISLKIIYRDARFWGLAPLSATCAGAAWALQGLWATPWLTDVDGLPQADVTRHLLIIAIVQGIAALLLGAAADRLRRRGVGPQILLGFVATTFIAAQLALILRLPVSSYLPWSIVAAAGSGPILSYAILAEYFPKEITGRANGALNVFHFGAAFAIQYIIGVVIALWPSQDGHYPAIAYQVAFGLILTLQAAALAWFAFYRVRTRPLILVSAFRHRALERARIAFSSTTPRLHPPTGWDRLNSVQRQMSHWRVAALGSASLVALLSLTFAVSVVRANITPHTVATARPDEPLAILPKMEATAPSDAQIAYVLAGFVTKIRSLSVDPVIVRANWIDALDYVTARGARMLNAYARDESPFTKIGRRTVTTAVTKVVRAAGDAFEIHWEERILETGAPIRRERFTGAVSILFSSPSTARLISKNPLGLYVDRFTWWRDSIGDASP